MEAKNLTDSLTNLAGDLKDIDKCALAKAIFATIDMATTTE
jgi:hypothetical protein